MMLPGYAMKAIAEPSFSLFHELFVDSCKTRTTRSLALEMNHTNLPLYYIISYPNPINPIGSYKLTETRGQLLG